MLAIIGGTGLAQLQGLVHEDPQVVSTPYGETSAPLCVGRYAGADIVFLARHGSPHRIPPHRVNYRANLFALQSIGVTRVLAINTVGSINPAMPAGHLVVPDNLIDYTAGREHTFSDGSVGSELQHVDFSEPFSAPLRTTLIECLRDAGVAFSANGVYAVTQGPRLETAAEIRKYERDGCDVVGMTAMPEAALARELGLPYAMLCVVVNAAAGKASAPITLADMQRVLAHSMLTVQATLAAFIASGAGGQ